jgi:hypothetical protein
MSKTITVRLPAELADWLEKESMEAGISRSRIVKQHLESAKAASGKQQFMRLAGRLRRPKELSRRKGFSPR